MSKISEYSLEAKTAEAEKKREGEKSARVKAEKINEKLAAETAELEDALSRYGHQRNYFLVDSHFGDIDWPDSYKELDANFLLTIPGEIKGR